MRLKVHREILFELETNIGNVVVFEINFSDEGKLTQALSGKFSDAKPIDAIKQLFCFIGFPKGDLIDGKYKPTRPVFQNDDADKLSIEEIEKFAKKLVEKDKSLSVMVLKEGIAKIDAEKNGDIPECNADAFKERINDGESDIEFSYRLIVRYFKTNRDRIEASEKKFIKKFIKELKYPTSLLEEVEKQVSMSDSFIKEAQKYASISDWANYTSSESILEANASASDPAFSTPTIESSLLSETQAESPDYSTYMPETLDKILERNFKPLFDNLEQLNRGLVASKGFMGQTYKTIIKVAGILQNSSDSSKKFSILSLVVSGLVLILTIYTIGASNQSSKDIKKALQLNTNAVIGSESSRLEGLSKINNSLIKFFEASNAQIIQLEQKIPQDNKDSDLLELIKKQNELLKNIEDNLGRMADKFQHVENKKKQE